MVKIINRALRAALLDREFYQDAKNDTGLNQEALLVVILVSFAGGVSAFIASLILNKSLIGAIVGMSITLGVSIANYYIWVYSTHFIGTDMFQLEVEPGELLRVFGYASAPRLLSVLGFIPYLGPLLDLAGSIWALVAGLIGAQVVFDLGTKKSLLTVVFGWLVILIISVAVTNLLGISVAGLGSAFS